MGRVLHARGGRRELRSKDPNTQVGACIADTNHRILSVGYNGTPSALNDDDFPWGVRGRPLADKHSYVVHAEANAVLNYRGSLKDLSGATVYVTLFPCNECAKILAQVGIGEVVYLSDKYCGSGGEPHIQADPHLVRYRVPRDGARRLSLALDLGAGIIRRSCDGEDSTCAFARVPLHLFRQPEGWMLLWRRKAPGEVAGRRERKSNG